MNQIEIQKISPLMPKEALSYFVDGTSGNRLYLRATSIRNCLENIVETIFIYIIDDNKKNKWRKENLNGRLELLKDFFPQDINEKLHKIRKVGNKGAHQAGHKDLIEEEIELTLNDLSQICELTILSYFKKYGFIEHSWIPTVFSTLPPVYRIRILEQLFTIDDIDKEEFIIHQEEAQNNYQRIIMNPALLFQKKEPTEKEKKFDGFVLLIDKLSMAYLKNKDPNKGVQFICDLYDKGYINEFYKNYILEKLQMLWHEIDNLPISTSLEETKNKLTAILPAVREDEESLFITLFTAIVSQNS